MIGVVVAAHSDLAEVLLRTARLVVPTGGPVAAVGIEVSDTSATYEPRLLTAIRETDRGEGVLVLTDMFGGTPANVGMTMHQVGQVEVLTGVNLPMVIKALQLGGRPANLSTMAHEVKLAGLRSITVATEVLSAKPPPDDALVEVAGR